MTKINYGFTLAEVLITLGIIGVVAAMTMPSLIANHQEKVTVTKVKKVYSILSQAYLIAVEEYGTPDEWGTTARDAGDENDENYSAGNAVIIREKLFKGLQKISICDKAKNQKACNIADAYYWPAGSKDNNLSTQTASAGSADGTGFLIIANTPGEKRGPGVLSQTYAIIYADINGTKKPNTYGKDLFAFYLTNDNITPLGTKDETFWSFDTCFNSGVSCTAWVVFNENTDYLHCNDLSWSGKRTCK